MGDRRVRLRLAPRRAHVFFTAAVVYLAIKFTQKYVRLVAAVTSSYDSTRVWSRTHSWCAQRLLRLAMKRRALWLKFCQYISSRADVLPGEYISVLESCLDDVPPEPADVTLRTVAEELGGRAPDELFDGFDPAAPIASASIAQVHRATVRSSGTDVVLKVQRPGVAALLKQDLEDLKTIMLFVAGSEPEFDFRPMLDAWIEMVPRETNFRQEMDNAEDVRGTLDKARGSDFSTAAIVPRSLKEFTTEKLLVVEYVKGCGVKEPADLDAAGVDKEQLVTEITKAFALQIHVLGKMSGDAHAGNVLCQFNTNGEPGGIPALIDFGITVELSEEQRIGFCRCVCAAVDGNSYSLLQSFEDMGIVLNRADPSGSMALIRHLFRSTASREDTVRQSKEFLEEQRKRTEKREKSGIAVGNVRGRRTVERTRKPRGTFGGQRKKTDQDDFKRNPVDAMPGYIVFLFRTIALLRGLCTRLGVSHAYLPILSRYARQALMDACPEPERAMSVIYPKDTAHPVAKSLCTRKADRARAVVSRVLEALEKRKLIIGCQVAAYKDGELVLDIAAGRMGKYNPRPVMPSTLFNGFSVSKGIVSILYGLVADTHSLKHEDLVSTHWPAFVGRGKAKMQIKHILSHTAGLGTVAPPDMSMTRLRDDWKGVIAWLATDAEPAYEPGTKCVYHFITFGWLVGGLLEAVTGRDIQELWADLARDLGIEEECMIGLPEELCANVSTSGVAELHSEVLNDLGKMLKRTRTKSDLTVSLSASEVAGEKKSDASDSAEAANMESLYGDDDSGNEVKKHVASLFFSNGTNGSNGEVTAVEVSAMDQLQKVLTLSPYLLDPNYFNHPVMRAAVVPSANGHMSARALARIYAMVANKGKLDGRQIMDPDRPEKMMEELVAVEGKGASGEEGSSKQDNEGEMEKRRNITDRNGEAFGAGLRLYDLVDKKGRAYPKRGLGHSGLGGSMGFCIPDHNFSFAFTCNQMNAVSTAEAVLMVVVCMVMEVPIPAAYSYMLDAFDGENFQSVDEALAKIENTFKDQTDRLNVMQAMTG